MMLSATAALVLATAAGQAAASEHDGPSPPASIALAEDLIVVTTGSTARIHDGSGRLLARLPAGRADGDPALAGGDPSASDAAEARERIWDRAGIPDEERDSDAAQDLADDELLRDERRAAAPGESAAPAPPHGPPALAASAGAAADRLLVIAAGQLFAVRSGRAPALVARAPAGVRALAATEAGVLFAADADGILLSGDGGRHFRRIARELGVRALVAHPAGDFVAWSTDRAVVLLEPSGRQRRHAVTAARSLQVCGGALIILGQQGLLLTAPGRTLDRRSGPLPAQHLVCDDQGPWLAVGPGLLASTDGGRSFRARRDAPRTEALAAAVGWDRLWVLGAAGLMPLSFVEPARPRAPSAVAEAAVPWPTPRSGWLRLLPRVGVLASHLERDGQPELRALVFAELPLAPRPRPLLAQAPLDPNLPPPAPSAATAVPPADISAREAACLADARRASARLAGADPDRAESLVRRAGRSAWLPELRLRLERRLGRSESLDLKPTTSADALGLDTDNDVRYEIRATWDLPRLVFHPEEVAAAHQALRMADMRREIESQVNRLYFERRRLTALPAEGTAEVERAIRIEELGAELDALSEGAFGRCLRAQGR